MDLRQRLGAMIRSIPPAQQAGIAVALVILVLASFMFFRWVTTPSYTVLYSELEATQVQTVIDELESQGVSYRLEAAGTRVLVPRSQVYEVRAALAAAGVQGAVVPQGYELLDGQSLTITDFQQRVAYQRALEGEIAKTLMAMKPIQSATVHLVMPEEPLFEQERKPTTASVLVAPVRSLTDAEVESIISIVSSSVEGLDRADVTVADASGMVLHAAGEESTGAGMVSRTLRQSRQFEQLLANDLTSLLTTVLGPGRASVVVRAHLDFDLRTRESETFGREEAPTIREQTMDEEFTGTGAAPGGALGVDGGVVATG
ncbi:MAG TPA: flagellar basal-body MS-ring/collar protein FliF, partial [Acidimicrobiia bacterium]|nr:flagellar basal-body MS-ring/collar protein FliF [Acidimicrobiia bacterium]